MLRYSHTYTDITAPVLPETGKSLIVIIISMHMIGVMLLN